MLYRRARSKKSGQEHKSAAAHSGSQDADDTVLKFASDQLMPEVDAVETSRPGELDSRQRYEMSADVPAEAP